jgi:hypothetical protein
MSFAGEGDLQLSADGVWPEYPMNVVHRLDRRGVDRDDEIGGLQAGHRRRRAGFHAHDLDGALA